MEDQPRERDLKQVEPNLTGERCCDGQLCARPGTCQAGKLPGRGSISSPPPAGHNYGDGGAWAAANSNINSNIKDSTSSASGLTRYLHRINNYPMLEPQEEYELAKRWCEHGDIDARNKLTESYLRLAAKIAKDHRGYRCQEDMITEGALGLMEALENFDPEKGFTVGTYARKRITGSIRNYAMRSCSLLMMDTTDEHQKLFFAIQREKARIGVFHNNDMTPEQLEIVAERLNMNTKRGREKIVEMNRRRGGDVSLNKMIESEDADGNDTSCEFGDLLADGGDTGTAYNRRGLTKTWSAQVGTSLHNSYDEHEAPQDQYIKRKEVMESLVRKLSLLNPSERHIVEARWLPDDKQATYKELADEIGCSPARVQQIEQRAFDKMGIEITELKEKKRRPVKKKKDLARVAGLLTKKWADAIRLTREQYAGVEKARAKYKASITSGDVYTYTPEECAEVEQRLRMQGGLPNLHGRRNGKLQIEQDLQRASLAGCWQHRDGRSRPTTGFQHAQSMVHSSNKTEFRRQGCEINPRSRQPKIRARASTVI